MPIPQIHRCKCLASLFIDSDSQHLLRWRHSRGEGLPPLPCCWPIIEGKWTTFWGEEERLWAFFLSSLKWSELGWPWRGDRGMRGMGALISFCHRGPGGWGRASIHANSTSVSSWGKVSWQQLDQPPGFLISPAPPMPSGLWHLIWMAKMNIGLGRWSRNPSFLPHLVPLQIFTQILSLWLKF